MASKTIENRIARIEAILGIESPPSNWGITKKRVEDLEKKVKYKYQAKDKLIQSLGETVPEEDE